MAKKEKEKINDDKLKEWQVEFIQGDATFGFIFTLIGLVYYILSTLI